MSIEQRKVIDIVGVDEEANEVVLTISDHLRWDDPKSNHLLLLQDKINDYLAFIESGELLETYPDAKGRKPIIQVYAKHPLNDVAEQFYKKVAQIVANAGFELRFRLTS